MSTNAAKLSTGVARASRARLAVERFLARAGVDLGGASPWDIQVHDERTYERVLRRGSLGMGEAYMDAWWDCARLDELALRLLTARVDDHVYDLPSLLTAARLRLLNGQTRWRARQIANAHYDLDSALFESMLGSSMTYSCGYWRSASSLDEAQRGKHELIAKKLALQPGMRVLDIGCGWGTFARWAAERHGCTVVAFTVSPNQAEWARSACAGLPVEILLEDYRSPRVAEHGLFDRVVSIGMFEHVGRKNYRRFMKIARSSLQHNGLMLLHTIGSTVTTTPDAWMEKYIFPNGMLPSPRDLAESVERLFVIEDWHNFGADYDRTLMAWHANFERAVAEGRYRCPDRFYRMWRYYLLTFAGAFRVRDRMQLWEVVLSPDGVPGGYTSVR